MRHKTDSHGWELLCLFYLTFIRKISHKNQHNFMVFFLLLLFLLLLLLDKVSEICLALVNEFYVQTKKSNTITYLT